MNPVENSDSPWWADAAAAPGVPQVPLSAGSQGSGPSGRPVDSGGGGSKGARFVIVAVGVVVAVLGGLFVFQVMGDSSTEVESQVRSDSDDEPERDRQRSDVPRADTQTDLAPARVELPCAESGRLAIEGLDVRVESLSREQEVSIGANAVPEILSFYPVASDDPSQTVLDELLAALDPGTPGIDYDVTLVDGSDVNAFAIPGGQLFFTTAIMDELTNDELGFVMAHEIAHVACRHSAQQIEREALVVATVSALLGDEVDVEGFYNSEGGRMLADFGSLSFSRSDESEADIAAVGFMRNNGFDLDAAVAALRALRALEGDAAQSSVDVFFSTHPATDDRIARVQAETSR